ncbi:MAG TPA: radical SAM family heme chaperone HemW [Acidimicrobiales bacterium]
MNEFGVYVHVPFCRERCDYCAFATYTDRDHLMERYADAVITELVRQAESGALIEATSIFFGGGTPSRLDPALLGDILDAIPRAADCEITIECNPEDADPHHLDTYAAAGANRLSFGLQSTHSHVLDGLGRRHVPDAAATISAAVAAAGYRTWNLDLIFGSPAETDDDWQRTLEAVLSLPSPPPHLSAYALTVEPGTPLATQAGRHPDEDALARRYGIVDDVLSAAGYKWEEISNWAKPGHECRHNHLYWEEGDYLGFGSAAHSHRAGERWWNVRTPDRYIHVIESGGSPVASREVLTAEQRDFERLTLALRTPRGVPWHALRGADELDDLIERRGDHAVLTVRGRLLANQVSTRIALP